jgi:histidinol-phosphatase
MSEFLDVAIDAAREAEEVIMKHFRKGPEVMWKPDGSPVTPGDKEAEKIVKEVILDAFPDHGFLGEESGRTNPDSPYVWIVDPIDETRNYARQVPIFATLIALMKDGELIVGVSNAPAIPELLTAEKGKGAYQNGTKISVSSIPTLSEANIGFGGIKHFDREGRVPELLSLANAARGATGFGGFWSFSLLAEGHLDVVVHPRLSIWDMAAHTVIVEEAGGKMTDISGKPVDLDTKSALASNGLFHDEALAYFRA